MNLVSTVYKHTVDGQNPTLKPWLKPLFAGIYGGKIRNQVYLGAAKWISRTHPQYEGTPEAFRPPVALRGLDLKREVLEAPKASKIEVGSCNSESVEPSPQDSAVLRRNQTI